MGFMHTTQQTRGLYEPCAPSKPGRLVKMTPNHKNYNFCKADSSTLNEISMLLGESAIENQEPNSQTTNKLDTSDAMLGLTTIQNHHNNNREMSSLVTETEEDLDEKPTHETLLARPKSTIKF